MLGDGPADGGGVIGVEGDERLGDAAMARGPFGGKEILIGDGLQLGVVEFRRASPGGL